MHYIYDIHMYVLYLWHIYALYLWHIYALYVWHIYMHYIYDIHMYVLYLRHIYALYVWHIYMHYIYDIHMYVLNLWHIYTHCIVSMTWVSLAAQAVRNLPAMRETQVWSLGWENPLEKGMALHSSTPAWRIPWTEKPGGLQSMGSQRVRHDWATSISLHFIYGIYIYICWPCKQCCSEHWDAYSSQITVFISLDTYPEDVHIHK